MIWTAFILGLISSLHCIGMCGPLMMIVPVHTLTPYKKNIAIVLYHLGRVVTYSLLGLIIGVFSRHFYIAGYQQNISIIAGSVILFILLYKALSHSYQQPFFIKKFTSALHGWMQYFWHQHSIFSSFALGMLNGILPCGMVYFALIAAVSEGSLLHSYLYMLLFGAGTLPLMMAAQFAGISFLNINLRNKIKKAIPAFVACVGMLLILRGLNLNIPYISPYISSVNSKIISCH